MTEKKRLLISIAAMLTLVVGVTFAYFVAQISDGAIGNLTAKSGTLDDLKFDVDKDISMTLTQFNFTKGGSNLSETAVAKAALKANSTTKSATYDYYVYLIIKNNEFIYTTTDKKAEIVLSITDPNGNDVSSLSGLTYLDGSTTNGVTGFDITEATNLITIAENYQITSSSSDEYTNQTWTFKITFINLDTNQIENQGKELKVNILMKKNAWSDLTLSVTNLPTSYGKLASVSCNNGSAFYNEYYNRVEISSLFDGYNFCSLKYTNRTDTITIADYVTSLVGTTQGDGQVIDEKVNIANYSGGAILNEDEYTNLSKFLGSGSYSTSGTAVDAFTYSSNKWVSNNTNMESGKFYHLKYSPKDTGYYQFCYNLSSGNSENRFWIYIKNLTIPFNDYKLYVSPTETESRNDCVDLGYIENSNYLNIVFRPNESMSTLSFYMKKANNLSTKNAGIRYEGKEPNNYIWFNNELWRIIGVFDSSSHGVDNENLVKIIRNKSIGNYSLSNKIGYWGDVTLNSALNNYYLYNLNGSDSGLCYHYSYAINCDFRKNGIIDEYRNMIKNVKWFLGGSTTYGIAERHFLMERGNNTYNGYRPFSFGKIGLIYPSDYGFASLVSKCKSNTSLNDFGTCSSETWLKYIYNSISLSHYISDGVNMNIRGNLTSSTLSYPSFIYPVLYLANDVYLIDGDGTFDNPYRIGQ